MDDGRSLLVIPQAPLSHRHISKPRPSRMAGAVCIVIQENKDRLVGPRLCQEIVTCRTK